MRDDVGCVCVLLVEDRQDHAKIGRTQLKSVEETAQPPSPVGDRTPASNPSQAIRGFDTGLLLDSCMGKGDFAQEILQDFKKGLDARIEELIRVVVDSPQQVATVAHSLKGAAGIVGAIGIWHIAAELESAGQRGELEPIRTLLDGLVAEATEFSQTLPAIRQKLAGKAFS